MIAHMTSVYFTTPLIIMHGQKAGTFYLNGGNHQLALDLKSHDFMSMIFRNHVYRGTRTRHVATCNVKDCKQNNVLCKFKGDFASLYIKFNPRILKKTPIL